MQCPVCHFDNGADRSSCAKCGARLPSGGDGLAARHPSDEHAEGSDDPGRTTAIPASTMNLEIGSTVAGHYRITEEIGRGGMGVVYKAEDARLKRAVALKFLSWWLTCDQAAKQRFVHEAQAASALDHTNICTIYEVDETRDGQMFMVMAFCEGEPLKKRIERGPLAVEDALDIAIQICDGLATAHDAGMIHRDMKPANIMVNDRGHVKIVDFGLAKLAGQTRLTRAGTVVGTVAYMSPEQARGDEVDARTDIWSLGVILYEILTGQLPFRGDNDQAVLHSILNDDPQPPGRHNKEVAAALDKAVLRCLKKDADERYATADDLQAELVAIRGAHPAISASGRVLKRAPAVSPKRRARRRRAVAFCLAAAACAVAALSLAPPGRPLVNMKKVVQLVGIRWLPVERFVVILPPAVASGDPEAKALADGLFEVQTRKMMVIDGFADSVWVAPVGEIFSSSSAIRTPADARDLLGANLAMTGNVVLAGDTVGLSLDLVDTDTGVRLKSRRFRDPLANLATWQDSVAVVMARMLDVSLSPDQRARLRSGCTAVPSAFKDYLVGRGYMSPYGGAENPGAATASLKRAVAADSCFALAYSALGDACFQQLKSAKDTAWASLGDSYCKRAVELGSGLAAPRVTLGLIDQVLGKPERAAGHIESAIAADSSYSEAYARIIGIYKQMGRRGPAIAAAQRLIALRPKSYNAYNTLGEIHLSGGEYEKAIKAFRAMIRVAPRRSGGYNNLGAAYYYLERLPEAEEMFERSIEIAPQYRAYSNLGSINFYNARYADAADMYKKAIDIKDKERAKSGDKSKEKVKGDYPIWGHYAEACYWAPGEKDRGIALYQTAISMAEKELESSDDSVTVMADLASYCALTGDRARSKAYLQRVIAAAPADGNVAFRLAETYEGFGEREKALEWVGRALDGGIRLLRIERAPGLGGLMSDRRFATLRERERPL